MGSGGDRKHAIVKSPKGTVPDVPAIERQVAAGSRAEKLFKRADETLQLKSLGMVIDATGSRTSTWARAQIILRTIFERLSRESRLQIRLVHFGGGELKDLGWSRDVGRLQDRMAGVSCQTGGTKIIKSLEKFLVESQGYEPGNVVLIGDAYEEGVDDLKKVLKRYREKKIRIFTFYESRSRLLTEESREKMIFRKIAKVTNGVFQEYRENAYLDDLMMAVAVYAAQGESGLDALAKSKNQAALALKKELLQIEAKPE